MGKSDRPGLVDQEKGGEPAPFLEDHPLVVQLGHFFFLVGQTDEREAFYIPHIVKFDLGVLADRGYFRLKFLEFIIIFLETVQVPLGLLSGESPQKYEENILPALETGKFKGFALKIHQGKIRGR